MVLPNLKIRDIVCELDQHAEGHGRLAFHCEPAARGALSHSPQDREVDRVQGARVLVRFNGGHFELRVG